MATISQKFPLANAFDVKFQIIGVYYVYAEARKPPKFDGVVDRKKSNVMKKDIHRLTPE